MLTVEHISKTYAVERGVFRRTGGTVAALSDVSVSLGEGKVLGVIGESGSGKTTLGRIICGLLTPDRGRVLFDGTDARDMSRGQRAGTVQMIFQDPYASLNPRLSLGTALAEAVPEEHKAAAPGLIAEMLETIGLDQSVLGAYPHQFSGGQRQRIAIARALLRRPRLVVADEPLSALDLTIQSQLLALFRRLREKMKLSIVFITHDITAAAVIADEVIVMQSGRIVEAGKPADILRRPSTGYAKKLIAAVPAVDNLFR